MTDGRTGLAAGERREGGHHPDYRPPMNAIHLQVMEELDEKFNQGTHNITMYWFIQTKTLKPVTLLICPASQPAIAPITSQMMTPSIVMDVLPKAGTGRRLVQLEGLFTCIDRIVVCSPINLEANSECRAVSVFGYFVAGQRQCELHEACAEQIIRKNKALERNKNTAAPWLNPDDPK